ncbi:MAG: hypothetical protein ACREFC_06855, partial [Stellaceae bacterium]
MIDDGIGNAPAPRTAEASTGANLPALEPRLGPEKRAEPVTSEPAIDLPRDIAREPPRDISRETPRPPIRDIARDAAVKDSPRTRD